MMNFLKTGSRPRKAPQSVLGLSWEGRRIECTLLRRTPAGFQTVADLRADLAFDIDSGDPESVGKELRARLDQAGIRERTCAVALPVSGLLVTQTEIPILAESDAESLLRLEAEKGFHADAATLQVACSRSGRQEGSQWVTLAALPQSRLAALERMMEAARLRLVSVSSALGELQPPSDPSSEEVIALNLGSVPGPVALQITAGGGIVALRSFEEVTEDPSGQSVPDPDGVVREIRITLRQLPEPWSGSIRTVRIYGPASQSEPLAEQLQARLAISGFKIRAHAPEVPGLPRQPAPTISAIIAARVLACGVASLEFLPPKPSVLQQFLVRHAQGPRRTVWTVTAAVTALVVLAFLVQQVQLTLLESRWARLSGKVRELERIQQDLRQYRPWTPASARGLAILEALSSAFPDNGSVTAKVVEIRESGEVVCSGTATDSPSFLAMSARLSALPGVSKVHHDQSRGASPMQFNLTFVWNGGVAR